MQLLEKIKGYQNLKRELETEINQYFQNQDISLIERFTVWKATPLSLKDSGYYADSDTPEALLKMVQAYASTSMEYAESDSVEVDFLVEKLLENNVWAREFVYAGEKIKLKKGEAEKVVKYVVENNIGSLVDLTMYDD